MISQAMMMTMMTTATHNQKWEIISVAWDLEFSKQCENKIDVLVGGIQITIHCLTKTQITQTWKLMDFILVHLCI